MTTEMRRRMPLPNTQQIRAAVSSARNGDKPSRAGLPLWVRDVLEYQDRRKRKTSGGSFRDDQRARAFVRSTSTGDAAERAFAGDAAERAFAGDERTELDAG